MNKLRLITFLFFTTLVSASYQTQVLSDNPLTWWRFNDNSSVDDAVARDSIDNISPSSFYDGDISIVEGGVDGMTAWFNGHDGGIDLGIPLRGLLNGSNAITVEGWIRIADLPTEVSTFRPLLCSRINDAQAGFEVLLSFNGNSAEIRVGARSDVSDSYQLVLAPFTAIDQWCHLVCISDLINDEIRIYVNGLLVKTASVNFNSDFYKPGNVYSQSDQIGRDCGLTNYFRGWIDEVAVYDKALSLQEIQEHYNAVVPSEPTGLWVSEAFPASQESDVFYGSPSLVSLDNGHIVASHDFFGDGVTEWKTSVSRSIDGGLTWSSPVYVNHMFWASMFEYSGVVYLLGVYSPGGSIVISKSLDEGVTWTIPYSSKNGYLFPVEDSCYTTGSVSVLFHNGRIYRSFEDKDEALDSKFKALVISADLSSDLLDAANWTMSNKVIYDIADTPEEWGATLPVWLEGSTVADANGNIWVVERFNSYPMTGKAALLKLSNDGKTLSWNVDDSEGGFIDMPGAMHKFAIRHDPATGLFLSIVNNNTDSNYPQQRNTLSLIASEDLRNWKYVKTLIQDNSIVSWDESVAYVGFQYIDWQFDGDDIIYLSRTAYDGAVNYHDANRITFHRLQNYTESIFACGGAGYSVMDFNFDCNVDFEDFSEFAIYWFNER